MSRGEEYLIKERLKGKRLREKGKERKRGMV
jgi:hypothetical protein